MVKSRPTRRYYYRGMIERGDMRRGYRWVEGYSEAGPQGGVLYPWSTRAECRREAAAAGCRAVFVKEVARG